MKKLLLFLCLLIPKAHADWCSVNYIDDGSYKVNVLKWNNNSKQNEYLCQYHNTDIIECIYKLRHGGAKKYCDDVASHISIAGSEYDPIGYLWENMDLLSD